MISLPSRISLAIAAVALMLTALVASPTNASPVRNLPTPSHHRALNSAAAADISKVVKYTRLRNRVYSPELGRFLSRDPLGFGGGDFNLYRYAAGNPIAFRDPTGLQVPDFLRRLVYGQPQYAEQAAGHAAKGVTVGIETRVAYAGAGAAAMYAAPLVTGVAGLGYAAYQTRSDLARGHYGTAAGRLAIGTLIATNPELLGPIAALLGTTLAAGNFDENSASSKLDLFFAGAGLRSTLCPTSNEPTVIKRNPSTLAPPEPIEVTEAVVRAALQRAELTSPQPGVSLPMIVRYVRMLEENGVPPPIKVDGSTIVEGNHRYVSGLIFGKEPSRVPGSLPDSQLPRVRPMSEMIIDPADWDPK